VIPLGVPFVDAFAPCVPRPCARPRFDSVRRIAYTSKASERAAREQATLLGPFTPREPLIGALAVRLHYVMPMRGDVGIHGLPHRHKPDADNLAKLTLDVLSRLGWWSDDCQVSSLTVRKRYGSVPGVHVRVDRDE